MRLFAVALVALPLVACSELLPGLPDETSVLEGPVEGLSPAQLAIFIRGDGEFARRFGSPDGLGPIFVAQSCESCHAGDGKGHPVFNLSRFGRRTATGFDPMRSVGGPQLQHRSVQQYVAEVLPSGTTGVAVLTPPAVTGLGYLEAVDDSTLIRMADPDDANGDGISGRLQLLDSTDLLVAVSSFEQVAAEGGPSRGRPVEGRYIGRFGKKGVAVNLLHQVVTAYHEDMGLTTAVIPNDIFNPQLGTFTTDDVPDPEVGDNVVSAVTFYLQTLRAPPRRGRDEPDVVAGDALFAQAGCAGCHVPQLTTGASLIAPLNRTTFSPYTDLLLHDLGPELDDGYTEGSAATAEWRTAPLWGLGLAAEAQGGQVHLLHDGRATSLRAAIDLHGGEGAASRAAFGALTVADQERVLRFLESL